MAAAAPPAYALTAADVADKMNAQHRNAWVFGALAAHLYRRMGDSARANCIVEWGMNTDSVREIDENLRANPTLQAASVMDVLIARNCAPKP